jgi:bifunctional non-homologous end joining protein LigD
VADTFVVHQHHARSLHWDLRPYVLFRTGGQNWMIHRMGPPPAGWTPIPERIEPAEPVPANRLPGAGWGYELAWDGVRAVAYVSGGRLGLRSPGGADLTAAYPELRALAGSLAPVECVLDGEVVAFDRDGRISRERLRTRRSARVPVHYLAYDVVWLDGVPTADRPYEERRTLLDALALAGPNWQTPPYFGPGGGTTARDLSAAQGLGGVVAKKLSSPYGRDWRLIPARTG